MIRIKRTIDNEVLVKCNFARTSIILFFTISVMVAGFFSCALPAGNTDKGYALIYGITDYNLVQDLVLTRNDAEEMSSLFKRKGYEVLLRIDNDNGIPASLEQLKEDINYVKSVIRDDQNFVFYFSGHGGRHVDLYYEYSNPAGNESAESDSDDEWLFLYGSLYSAAFEDWDKTAVSDDELGNLVSGIPTPNRLIVIDACNSAGFIGNSADIDNIPSNYTWQQQTEREGIYSKAVSLYFSYPGIDITDIPYDTSYVLSASGEREFSWENSGIQHGIFTYYFLQSPVLGDRNQDGVVTIDEIYNFTSTRIINDWNSQITNTTYHYHPHVSGGAAAFSLFSAD